MALLILIGLAIYFLPSMIGAHKRNAVAIFALNLFLGWTLVGWVLSLVWALTEDAPTIIAMPAIQYAESRICADCRSPLHTGQKFCQVCGTRIAWKQIDTSA
jgi:hypothetical protein